MQLEMASWSTSRCFVVASFVAQVAAIERLVACSDSGIDQLARRTLQKLTKDLIAMDIGEILAIADQDLVDLFAASGFGPDPLNATLMTLPVNGNHFPDQGRFRSLKEEIFASLDKGD